MTNLTFRFKTILNELENCDTFADIGCDHGYIAESMLERKKCNFVYITDISAECLKKAEKLLSKQYQGQFSALVRDGMKGVPKVDQVLIAGMGGELISDILQEADFLPKRLVVQPMKNPEKVRITLLKLGYKLIKDYTFKDCKYYDLMVCERGEDFYSEDEIIFGRDNLKQKGEAFREQIQKKIAVLEKSISSMNELDKESAKKLIQKYREVIL